MFLSCVLKKPDVEDEENTGDNSFKPDEEVATGNMTRSQQDIQGRWNPSGHGWVDVMRDGRPFGQLM
jgi:hypothetical protein